MADVFSNEFSIKVEDMDMKGFKLKGGVQKDEPKNHFSAAELYYNGKDVKCHIFWNRDCGFPPMVKWLSDADNGYKSSLVRSNNVALGVEKALDELWVKKFGKSPWYFQKPQTAVIPQVPESNNNAATILAGIIDDEEIDVDYEEIEEEVVIPQPQQKIVHVWTDGGCRGNGADNAVGGWGIVIQDVHGSFTNKDGKPWEYYGGKVGTTNNEMELTAAIETLKLMRANYPLVIVSDSQYLVNGMTKWVQGWIKKGWRKSDGKEVMNLNLWKELVKLSEGKQITWIWEEGHDPINNPHNDRADTLANMAMDEIEMGGKV
jgi:ribonuclease HI